MTRLGVVLFFDADGMEGEAAVLFWQPASFPFN